MSKLSKSRVYGEAKTMREALTKAFKNFQASKDNAKLAEELTVIADQLTKLIEEAKQ